MTAVSNAGPLIHLAKIGRLELIKSIFGDVVVPKTVWTEVVKKGKEKGEPNAFLVDEARYIKVVEDPTGADEIAKMSGIHEGEACAILLAKSMGVPVLLDDPGARRFAQGLGLTVIGSVGSLIRAVRLRIITVDDGLRYIGELANVMWLSVGVYERARRVVEEMRHPAT